ncbi:OmpA family protein [Nocardia bovistercoris]|uniref:OmpA family protein n=1 Tax=Nocardia bovistercoris TaxID=2785916 RepID=A0A931N575_9NOCA|nr:OmpA family protein [Nocardia bovistercoris]MBH0779452.1 OmpA family protein [Nocardia bovistercoris]
MTTRKYVFAVAFSAAALLLTTACDSGNDSDSSAASTANTTTAAASTTHAGHTSLGATASSVVSSALDTARQGIQNAINAALAAAPISFDSGSSDLGTVDEVTLKAVAIPLQGNDTRIRVSTYAADADVAKAKSLAEARGNNIAAALEADGVDRARITVRAEANPSDSGIEVDEARIEVVAG